MADNIGSTLGKYEILEELGRGGFGAVYRVRNRDLEREEALKVLGQHRQWDPTFVRRFQREARAAARLRHPHIVTIYEVGEAEGTHYLSMEYLPGRTLAQLIAAEGALPPARVARIIGQIAEALDYAHAQGLIHRDVKPSNVMVGPGDDVTLMDFGLVKAADHSELSQELFSSGAGFTSAAAAMGTPEYMAPELAEPNAPAVDYRADIYSLGVVAYQALTGHLPFSAPTPVAVLRAHLDLAPPPLTQWVADLPASFSPIVLRALAKNPAERYPSAGGFATALTEAVRQNDAERVRAEKVAALYAQAEEALVARNWAAALAACGQVMALDASYRDVGALFDKANQGLAKQRAWEAQQEEMAAQYDQGLAHLAQNNWDEAIALLRPLATGDQIFRDADRKLAEAQAAQQAEAAQRQERIARLYEKALAAYRTARDHVAEILLLQPDWRDPTGALDRLVNGAVTQSEDGATPEGSGAARAQRSPWQIWGPVMAVAGLLLAIWGGARLAQPATAPQVVERVATQVLDSERATPQPTSAPAVAAITAITETDTALILTLAPGVTLELVRVPSGEFLMGSDETQDPQAFDDELPQHRISLPSYWIGKTEVTNAQYQVFVQATGHAKPAHWPGGRIPEGQDNHPVVNVSWDDAVAFCQWASDVTGQSIRLPTEAEWEKAARGEDGRIYPWGNEPPDGTRANFNNSAGDTTPVGSYAAGASPSGALDMAGNVGEWTSSLYKSYPCQSGDRREGITDRGARVLRGGSFVSGARFVRCAVRHGSSPEDRFVNVGFRVVSPGL